MKSIKIFIAIAFLLFGQSALADKYVGQKSPTTQGLGFAEIDHTAWNSLLQKHVNSKGQVNYQAWKKSKIDSNALISYLNHLSLAQPKSKTSRKAKLAFWINAYNALTIQGILQVYPTKSIRDHTPKVFGYNIWKDLFLWVGGKKYNLDTIEHKILRKMREPKIHVAIVCASIGCPRLMNKAFTASNVQSQLHKNMLHFFKQSQNFRHDGASNTFYLSSILKWFKEDFGSSPSERLKYISKYLPTEASKDAAMTGTVKIKYLDYNWKLNKQ